MANEVTVVTESSGSDDDVGVTLTESVLCIGGNKFTVLIDGDGAGGIAAIERPGVVCPLPQVD